MSTISVDYDVLNQRGSPAWFTDTFANIPTAGYVGRMFISKDTFAFYRDTGTGWDLIGGPGIGTLTGSGVVGQVSFFNGTQVLAGNNNLFWDNVNSRLGINTTTPGQPLDIHSTGNTLVQLNNTTTANSNISFQNQNVAKWRVGNVYNAGANSFNIENAGLLTNALTISSTTNNITLTGALGGTSSTFSGNVNGGTFYSQAGIFLSTSGQATSGGGFATINGGNTYLDFRPNNGGIFLLSFPYNTTRTFTLPNADGTIALTSDLSSYLPLTGGTLTGNLNITNSSGTSVLGINSSTGNINSLGFSVNSISVGALNIGANFFQFNSNTANGYLFKNSATSNLLAISDAGIFTFSGTTNISGSLGLGVTAGATYKFDANAGIGLTDCARFQASTYTTELVLGAYASNVCQIKALTSQGLAIAVNSTTIAQYIASNGNVLINSTTDSGDKLQVNGNTTITGTLTNKNTDFTGRYTTPQLTLAGGGPGGGGATAVIGNSGMIGMLIVSCTQGVAAIFIINGASAPLIVSQSIIETRFSIVSGAVNTVNVYISGSDLIMENNIQATRLFNTTFIGKTS